MSSLGRSSAVMAAGTLFSRASGFIRSALLAAAIGSQLHADVFNLANTIPNMLYILLAGGVFNAVLVPQLVRAMKNDGDGGQAYADRLITLAVLFLGAVTAVLVLAAPLLLHLWLHGSWYAPSHAAELHSTIDFARWCLPQIFFYGMYVLIGQILNSRGSFGPMMWAPIANNIISIAVLVTYLVVFGPAATGGYSTGEEWLLGLGSTVGIAAQFVVLLPALRKAGFRYAPRFDFRGVGLSTTARLGAWTILFVIVNQVSFLVIASLATNGSADGGSGLTVFSGAWLVAQVPHSIITVSLATAILPVLSARASDGDAAGVAATLGRTLRSALALIGPIAVFMPVLALPIARVLFGYGASVDAVPLYVPALAWFAPGLVLWTVHYMLLRALYAYELNRQALLIQVAIAATNIATALVLVRLVSSANVAAALTAAYSASYVTGALVAAVYVQRRLGISAWFETVRFATRLLIVAAGAGAVAYAARVGIDHLIAGGLGVAVVTLIVAGGLGGVTLIALARLFHMREITSMVDSVTRRLRRAA